MYPFLLYNTWKGSNLENGLVPTEVIYNTIVNGYCRAKEMDKALSTVEQMEIHGLKPSCITFNTLISKFCDSGNMVEATEWVKKMAGRGVAPDSQTYNILIDGYGRSCQFESCFQILEEMESNGVGYSAPTQSAIREDLHLSLAEGFYLPWYMLGIDLILGNPLKPILLGMAAGHLYYFLTVLYPLAGGSPASTEAQPSSSVQAQPNAAAQPNQANDGLTFRGRSYRLDDHQ
ncbi:hypothetical protein RHGRI_008284 [Rhododendron griersonianum]|uniref:Derlin n=1 Tax=Rhododendron griersonianum TaxID=479676 RepID=A0AAV6L1S2_9ERIC|nr:hypothetical protein RHGRI_008284 [Rhododendron griersonianum]